MFGGSGGWFGFGCYLCLLDIVVVGLICIGVCLLAYCCCGIMLLFCDLIRLVVIVVDCVGCVAFGVGFCLSLLRFALGGCWFDLVF